MPQTLTYEFEQQFRNIEGVVLIIRQPRNTPIANSYDFPKRLSGLSSGLKLRERVIQKLGSTVKFVILDEKLNSLKDTRPLSEVRAAYSQI